MRLIEWMNNEMWPWAALGAVIFISCVALAATKESQRQDRCESYCNPYRVVKCDSAEVWCGDGRHKVKP